MSDYNCPVEGCDYGDDEGKTLSALRSHVNAKPEHPDWSDVEELLVDQADTGSVGETSSATSGTSTDPEGGDDQSVGAKSSASGEGDGPVQQAGEGDQGDSGTSKNQPGEQDEPGELGSDMVDDTELERQREQATDQGDSGQDDGGSSSPTTGGSSSTSGLPIPVGSTTVVVVVVVVVAGGLLIAYTRSGDGSDAPDPGPDQTAETGGGDPQPSDMDAGLVGGGADA